ncbi:MAG TPA: hypothetical protein VKB50_11905 [Vicinamibacterales bacterium]|nr:hypothetical protein [Vicinamibacterales bacterium]
MAKKSPATKRLARANRVNARALTEPQRRAVITAFVDDLEAVVAGGKFRARRRFPDPFIETEPDEHGDINGERATHRLTPAGQQLARVVSLLSGGIKGASMGRAAKVVLGMMRPRTA